jgi:hypothetical protein
MGPSWPSTAIQVDPKADAAARATPLFVAPVAALNHVRPVCASPPDAATAAALDTEREMNRRRESSGWRPTNRDVGIINLPGVADG